VVVVDSKGSLVSIRKKKQARQQQESTKDLVDSERSISRKKKENKQDNSKDKRFKIHEYSIVIQKLKGRSIHIVKMLDMIKRKEKKIISRSRPSRGRAIN